MKVLILSRRPDLYSPRRLLEEFERAGHSSILLDPDLEEARKQQPDLILPRFGTWNFEESLGTLEFYEKKRIPSLNRSASLRDARNKWISYLLLRDAELPVLPTSLHTKAELPQQYPYVAKVPDLSKGDGIFLVKNHEDRLALPLIPEWVVQPFIASAQGRDRRIIVSRDGFIAAMERTAGEGEFRSNLAVGGTAKTYEPSAREIQLAQDALDAHNLHIAGVDFLMTPQGPVINEVNGCPGLEGIEKSSGVNVAAAYVRLAENHFAKQPMG